MDIKKDFLKAHAAVSNLLGNAAGWHSRIVDEEVTGKMAYVYLYNYATAQVWAASLDEADADSAFPKAASMQDASIAVGTLLKEASRAEGWVKDNQNASAMAAALMVFIRTTKAYENMVLMNTGRTNHYVMLAYEVPGNEDTVIRPFISQQDGQGLLDTAYLKETITRVVAMDREAHPEWFPKSPTAAIKP